MLVQYVTRYDGRPIAKTEALKQSNLLNTVTSIVRRDSSFVAVVKSIMNFSATFKNEQSRSFLTARIVDIVEDRVSSDFLTCNRPQIYQRQIRTAKFLLQRLNIYNIIEDIYEKETGSKTLDISLHDDETLCSS